MLVLSRKNQESVVIGGSDGFHRLFRVKVLEIRGANVKLGFEVDPMFPSIVRKCGNESKQGPVRSPDALWFEGTGSSGTEGAAFERNPPQHHALRTGRSPSGLITAGKVLA